MDAVWVDRMQLAAALTLVLIGIALAWTSANMVKRLVGLVIAQIAAMLALAVLGAPPGAMVAGLAIAFAQLLVGAALIVRLQEAHGQIEAAEINAADEQSEPAEPAA